MMVRLMLSAVCCLFGLQTYSQQILGNFSGAEDIEWPQVIWYRDLANNWDEGLIKTAPNVSGISRSGFGIHLHESKQFTFWSTNYNPLLSVEGGTGKTYIKGNVGIGTFSTHDKLAVNGNIRAKEIKVDAANWPDYVFEEGYQVGTLAKLEDYIKMHKHLPEIPSAKEAEAYGVALGELNKLLLKKIEELTLLLIEEHKLRRKDTQRITELEKQLKPASHGQ